MRSVCAFVTLNFIRRVFALQLTGSTDSNFEFEVEVTAEMKIGTKISIVWHFFAKDADNKYVHCTICKKKFKFFGNTTNLKQHLVRVHPVQLRKEPRCKILGNNDTFESGARTTTTHQPVPLTSTDVSIAGTSTEKKTASDTEEKSQTRTVPKPRAKLSIVWTFFGKDEDEKYVNCGICKKKFRFFGNTTNLKQHLVRAHPVQLKKETRDKIIQNNDTFESGDCTTTRSIQTHQPVPPNSADVGTNTEKISAADTERKSQEPTNESSDIQMYAESASSSNSIPNKRRIEDEIVEKIPEIPMMNKTDDDAQIFGDFVASSIRNLRTDNRRRLMKRKIQAIILEIEELDEMDQLERAPHSTHNMSSDPSNHIDQIDIKYENI